MSTWLYTVCFIAPCLSSKALQPPVGREALRDIKRLSNARNAEVTSWTFFGRVLPERIPLTWDTPLEGFARSTVGVAFDFRVVIHASQSIVDLTVKEGAADVPSLRNIAADCIRQITDLVGYQQGCWFDVEVVSAICRDTGDWTVFGTEIPVLAARRHAGGAGVIDHGLLKVAGQSPAVQIVLADFREAMRVPVGTGLFCYRAIEAMMQSMKTEEMKHLPNKTQDDLAWDLLRERLRIDRSAIDEVKKHADLPRHGKTSSISDAERAKVFELTDEIIKRFLVYLVSVKAALTDQDFPILAR
jgi:hypothetical protein